MDLQALTRGALAVSSLLADGSAQQEGEAPPRYDRQIEATLAESDAILRSRARVEILYRAGDLPGALREALEGLEAAPSDLTLLRRALELETALHLPELAGIHAAALEEAVRRETLDEEARRWWEGESASHSLAARRMEAHQDELERATSRALWASILVLAAVAVASCVLARSGPRAAGTADVDPI